MAKPKRPQGAPRITPCYMQYSALRNQKPKPRTAEALKLIVTFYKHLINSLYFLSAIAFRSEGLYLSTVDPIVNTVFSNIKVGHAA